MIKSIYASSLERDCLEKSNANHLMVSEHGLNEGKWDVLKKLGVVLSIAIDAFNKEDCPLDPQAKGRLFSKVSNILEFSPEEIWLDGFRFGGDCTTIEEESGVKQAHQECKFCQGKDRKELINSLAREIKDKVAGKSKIGFFAVAFNDSESPNLSNALGLDYLTLGQILDISSPMLYHRMLGKPVEYIHEYVGWLAHKTGKPVLPIIQIKDMLDHLEDKMTEEEIRSAYREAIKPPSVGVAIFYWKHALEKGKTEVVSRLFSE